MKYIPKLISLLSSPYLIIPFFSLWVIATYMDSWQDFFLWGVSFLVFTFLPVVAYVAYGIKKGTITDFHIMVREQRSEPFLIATIGSFLLVGAYFLLSVPKPILLMAVLLTINAIIFTLITRFWKISIHAASFAGSVVIVSFLINAWLAFLLLLIPIIIWARIQRQRHTLWQGLAGAGLVSAINAFVLYYL